MAEQAIQLTQSELRYLNRLRAHIKDAEVRLSEWIEVEQLYTQELLERHQNDQPDEQTTPQAQLAKKSGK